MAKTGNGKNNNNSSDAYKWKYDSSKLVRTTENTEKQRMLDYLTIKYKDRTAKIDN